MKHLILILAVTLLATPQPPEPAPVNPRVGAVEPHDAPEFAAAMGVGWGRARFLWPSVQPNSPDEWIEAEITAAEIAAERAAGREVVGLLIGVAEWARDENGLPQGLDLPHDDPRNLWAAYVRQAVTRYDGQIDHWIIWNEPDVWDASAPGFTWPGDLDDFIQLMRISYLAAKGANPQATIHLAAMSHWWDASFGRDLYFDRLLTALAASPEAAENAYYYDVATLHLYFNPASVYEVTAQYIALQAQYGIDKPLWIVETNAAPSYDPGWPVADPAFSVSLLEQAAYQPQGLAMAFAAGAERVGIYKMVDIPTDYAANPEPFGLVRADSTPRPAYATAAVAVQAFRTAERFTLIEQSTITALWIEHPDDDILLIWSRVPSAQTIQLGSPVAAAHDMWGHPLEIEAGTITLSGAECRQTVGDFCMIGGPPVYVYGEFPDGANDDTVRVVQAGEPAYAPLTEPYRPSPLPLVGLAALLLLGAAGVMVTTNQLIERSR